MRFNLIYFAWFLLFLIIETCIALYVHDKIIRPYVGDILVVILIYCFVRAFTKLPVLRAGVLVLILAYAIELLQLFNVADKLGLKQGSVGYVVLGNSFDWQDLLMYSIGIAIVFAFERKKF